MLDEEYLEDKYGAEIVEKAWAKLVSIYTRIQRPHYSALYGCACALTIHFDNRKKTKRNTPKKSIPGVKLETQT